MSHPQAPRWKEWLSDPEPDAHLVQLYHDEEFFAEAVAHFAAEGLAKGEAVILAATRPHRALLSGRLVSLGLDPKRLAARGQLTLLDAEQTLPKFMVDGLPDPGVLKGMAREAVAKARAGGGNPGVRWWGEMVNVLYLEGNLRGSIRLEELFDELAREEAISIFCSFQMDKFDPEIYEGALQDVCRTHGHLIPTPDDARHRDCVDRAFSEVFGPLDIPSLDLLIGGSRWSSIEMPASQALLLWLRDAAPERLGRVLSRARALDLAGMSG